MHAVIGVWELDPAARDAQDEQLDHIVEGVSRLPYLVQGYWGDAEDSGRSHTVIVFDDRDAALAFAESVRGNVEQQARYGVRNISLDVVEVKATT